MPPSPRRSRGLSLVEVAIVLVVVGLLPGGSLKAWEPITRAQVRSVASERQAMQVA